MRMAIDGSARRSSSTVLMSSPVTREQVQQLVRQGAQLVEVLPSAEYQDEHLPGAINLPLKDLASSARDRLDPGRPVIVYCYDST